MKENFAEIVIEASENPKQPVTFTYTPTENGTSYLTPLTVGDDTFASGDSREVELEFMEDTDVAGDPWRTTLNLATQEAVGLGGMITVVLDTPSVGAYYRVGSPDTSTITVDDISIPELSIADSLQKVGGSNAEFVVTSDIPFVGDLTVTYNPVKADGII